MFIFKLLLMAGRGTALVRYPGLL